MLFIDLRVKSVGFGAFVFFAEGSIIGNGKGAGASNNSKEKESPKISCFNRGYLLAFIFSIITKRAMCHCSSLYIWVSFDVD